MSCLSHAPLFKQERCQLCPLPASKRTDEARLAILRDTLHLLVFKQTDSEMAFWPGLPNPALSRNRAWLYGASIDANRSKTGSILANVGCSYEACYCISCPEPRTRRSIRQGLAHTPRKSLDLLFKNYNDQFRHDVIIFHEGDFKDEDQAAVARGRTEIRFREIQFQVPDFLKGEKIPERLRLPGSGRSWGMGHRHMIRFYAVQIWDLLDEIGYDWMMRLDDDLFIHSKINYDLFKFMEKNGYEYGYRVETKEGPAETRGFAEEVLAYLGASPPRGPDGKNKHPSFFAEHFDPAPLSVHFKNATKAILMKVFPGRRYIMETSAHYDLWGYYNNFYISKVAFWKDEQVQAFINHFDRVGGWYKYRWNDLIFQTAALQVFMPKERIYRFTDWTYEHATIVEGKLGFGGIFEGLADQGSDAVTQFRAKWGATSWPPLRCR